MKPNKQKGNVVPHNPHFSRKKENRALRRMAEAQKREAAAGQKLFDNSPANPVNFGKKQSWFNKVVRWFIK